KNIFFGDSDVLKIGDFGLARTVPEEGSNEALTPIIGKASASGASNTGKVGTEIYAAPEQFRTNVYNQKADIYSLGIILLEMIYPMETAMEKHKTIENLRREDLLPEELHLRYPIEAKWIRYLTDVQP